MCGKTSKCLAHCHNTVRQPSKAAAKTQKKDYYTRIFKFAINIGVLYRQDHVYRQDHRAKKLDLPCLVPYVISTHLDGTLYHTSGNRKAALFTMMHSTRTQLTFYLQRDYKNAREDLLATKEVVDF